MTRRVWLALLLALAFVATGGVEVARAATSSVVLERGGFERGVEAFRRGDYAEAELAWRALLDRELPARQRARVFYNLGNAAWRRGAELEAVACYSACIRLDPRHADGWANLEFTRAQSGLEPADRGDLASTAKRLLDALSPAERAWLVLALAIALGLGIAAEAWRGGRLLRAGVFVLAGVLVLALVPWIHGLLESEADEVMVVRSPSIALRSEPRDDLPAVGLADAAAVLERIDALPGWVRVEDGEGVRGWVPEDAVFALDS